MTADNLLVARARIAIRLLALVLVFLMSTRASADSVSIGGATASGTAERLVMTGDVVVTRDEWVFEGDTAVYDESAGTFTLSGSVQLTTPDGVFSGNEAIYDWTSGEVTLDSGSLATTVASSSEPVFIRSGMVVISEASALFDASVVTACDLENPHWYLRCSSVELFPSDRVILRGATFYEVGVPLFWWPYLVLPLGEGALPKLPVIGYTAETGVYLSASTEYGNDSSGGTLQLDIYQKTGLGAGVKHDKRLSERLTATGSAYLFRSWGGDSYWAEIAGGLSGKMPNGLEVSANAAYKPYVDLGSLSKDEVRAKASVAYDQDRTKASGGYELIGSTVPLGFASHSLTGSISHSLSDRLRLDVRASTLDKAGYRQDSTPVDEAVNNHSFRLRYGLERGSLNLSLEDWTEYTASTYSITRKDRLVKTPELSLEDVSVPIPWSSRPLSLDMSVGDYSYWPNGSVDPRSASRVLVDVQQPNTRLVNSQRFTLSYSLAAGYRRYGSGDRLAYVAPKASASLSLWRFGTTLTHTYTEAYGYTPLVFDEVKRANKLTLSTSYRAGAITTSVQSSYDFNALKLDPVALWLRYSPEQKLAVDLSYSYDVTNRRPYSLIMRYDDQRDEDRTLRMGVNYSLESMSVKRAEAEISYKLTDSLRLATAVSYDGEKSLWNRGDVALIADLHCREIGLRYDIEHGRVWLEYKLYAFPSEPVKFGLDDDEGLLLESSLFSMK